ncbi:MAG: 2Fe-2S iron-sulfur cluster-binding protein [Acidimicrobiia bacterium]
MADPPASPELGTRAGPDWLPKHRWPDEDQVREALAGNLCRRTGYTKIVAAVLAAARARG